MKEIDEIFKKIDQEGNIQEIRHAIADLIIGFLKSRRNFLGYWERVHFANAIAALAWNVNLSHRSTTFWLRLCLVNVEKALVPSDQRDESYLPIVMEIDSFTFDQLMSDIIEVKQVC